MLLCLLVLVAPAHAAFPGQNGKIAFRATTAAGTGIHVIEPDGSGIQLVIPDRSDPAWSASGRQLAFSMQGVRLAEDDGTGQTLVRARVVVSQSPTAVKDERVLRPRMGT